MYISEINSAKAICVQADMSAAKAYQLIRDVDHTKFPVVDKEGKLVGIVEKSELQDISPSSSPFKELRFSSILSGTKVRDLMNNNVYYAKETDTIWTAALNMKDHRVSILPVVDEENRVTSVLARNDLFKALLNLVGAKYSGLFVCVTTKDKSDIYKISEILEKSGVTLLFMSSRKNKVTMKITDKYSDKAVEALKNQGFEVVYTIHID